MSQGPFGTSVYGAGHSSAEGDSMRAYQRPEMPSMQDLIDKPENNPVGPLEAELEDLRRYLNVAESLACGIEEKLSPVLVQQKDHGGDGEAEMEPPTPLLSSLRALRYKTQAINERLRSIRDRIAL